MSKTRDFTFTRVRIRPTPLNNCKERCEHDHRQFMDGFVQHLLLLVASLNWWLWLGLVGWLVVGVVLDVVIVAVDVF